MKKSITISVIIPNFNGERFIVNCIKSILKEKNSNYEIIIVDDISVDKSVDLIRKHFSKEDKVRFYIQNKKLGSAGARNEGAKHAKGQYFMFLDLDTTIDPGWYEKVIKFFQKYTNTGLAQPKLLIMGTNKFDYAGDYLGPLGLLIERAQFATDEGQFDRDDYLFSLKGACMLTRKSVFEKIGGFDADYEYLWEEPDYAWRVWLAGYEVRFMHELIIFHAFGMKKKSYYYKNHLFYRGCRNTIMTHIKNLGIRKIFTMLPINIVCWLILALLFLLKFDIPKGLAILKGVAANFILLPKTLNKRKQIQKYRKITDSELFALVGAKRPPLYYLFKAYLYIKQ